MCARQSGFGHRRCPSSMSPGDNDIVTSLASLISSNVPCWRQIGQRRLSSADGRVTPGDITAKNILLPPTLHLDNQHCINAYILRPIRIPRESSTGEYYQDSESLFHNRRDTF